MAQALISHFYAYSTLAADQPLCPSLPKQSFPSAQPPPWIPQLSTNRLFPTRASLTPLPVFSRHSLLWGSSVILCGYWSCSSSSPGWLPGLKAEQVLSKEVPDTLESK